MLHCSGHFRLSFWPSHTVPQSAGCRVCRTSQDQSRWKCCLLRFGMIMTCVFKFYYQFIIRILKRIVLIKEVNIKVKVRSFTEDLCSMVLTRIHYCHCCFGFLSFTFTSPLQSSYSIPSLLFLRIFWKECWQHSQIGHCWADPAKMRPRAGRNKVTAPLTYCRSSFYCSSGAVPRSLWIPRRVELPAGLFPGENIWFPSPTEFSPLLLCPGVPLSYCKLHRGQWARTVWWTIS